MDTEDRFKFLSLIGEGGMGQVFKVFDNESKRFCALKISKYSDDENEIDKTISEATLWFKFRKLAHVVEVYEIIRFDNNNIGILMEYLEGGNISILNNANSTLNNKILSLFDISCAILNCRSIVSGFAHLDIKPGNCLRTKYGLTKLSDFGLSCYANYNLKNTLSKAEYVDNFLSVPLLTNKGIRCAGTPLYMAPEQILGLVKDAQKSDVYSFGIMALELLSGEHPLTGLMNLDDIFEAHIQGINRQIRRWPSNIYPKLIAILDRTLDCNPNNRPSMQEINEGLKSAFVRPPMMLISVSEKLADPIEDSTRKAKSLWALGQKESAISILKNNLQADPFQADLWYYLARWESIILGSSTDSETFHERAIDICAYAFRAKILDGKYSQKTHKDYHIINSIIPQMAGQKFLVADDNDGYQKWGRDFFVQQIQWLKNQEINILESGGPNRCLCIKCGNIKMFLTHRCARCGFLPTEMEDIYQTYSLRIASIHLPNAGEESPYWAKMNLLRLSGKTIDKTISELRNDPEYMSAFNIFAQNKGKALQQLILYGGGKEMVEFMNHLRKTTLKPGFKDRIKSLFTKN